MVLFALKNRKTITLLLDKKMLQLIDNINETISFFDFILNCMSISLYRGTR